MVEPQDGGMWQKVQAALSETRQVAAAIGHANLPTRRIPSIDYFTSGWPNFESDSLISGPQDPPTFSEVPGGCSTSDPGQKFSELIGYIDQERPEIKARLLPHGMGVNLSGGREKLWLTLELSRLLSSILDRANALECLDDDSQLRALYCLRENAILKEALAVDLVVPLTLITFDLQSTFAVADNISIETMDEKFQAARTESASSIGTVPTPVASAATHAVVLHNINIPNDDPWDRLWRLGPTGLPLDIIDTVCQLLRIVTPLPLGYSQVLVRPLGWSDGWTGALPDIQRVAVLRRYPESFDRYKWLKSMSEATVGSDQIQKVPALYKELMGAKGNVRLAARRLSLTSLRGDDRDDRLIDACIGLEALLGEEHDELNFRYSLRASAILARTAGIPAETTFRAMKAIYGRRSSIAHGTDSKKNLKVQFGRAGKEFETGSVACYLLRELLMARLNDATSWTGDGLDSYILGRLNQTQEP